MRTRPQMLLRGGLLASLLWIYFLSPANASLINEQSGVWTVGPINVSNDYRNQYCSMRDTFNNGHDLVFARDIARVNSIAIDVKKKTFEPGRPYDLVLKVGGIARAMTAMSPNNHILLINMGKDAEFYRALAQGDYLTVVYQEQETHYALSGSSDALDILQECVEHLAVGKDFVQAPAPEKAPKKKPANTEAAKAQPNEAKPPKNKTVSDDSIRAELAQLKKQNQELQKSVSEIQKATENEKLKAELDELKKKNQALQSKADEIKAKKDSAKSKEDSDRAAQLQQKSAENEKLKAELALLKKQTQEKSSKSATSQPAAAPAVASVPSVPVVPAPVITYPFLDKVVAVVQSGVSGKAKRQSDTVYAWNQSGILISADAKVLTPGKAFEEAFDEFLSKKSASCKGDFAHSTGLAKAFSGKGRLMQAEWACINGKEDQAAAVLVVGDGHEVVMVSYDTPASGMGNALQMRDILEQNLKF